MEEHALEKFIMRFSLGCVLASLAISAPAISLGLEPMPEGIAIPISKRFSARNPDGTANIELLRKSTKEVTK